MKKLEIAGVIALCVLILGELTLSIISYYEGKTVEANYDLLWVVAMSFPLYNVLSSNGADR